MSLETEFLKMVRGDETKIESAGDAPHRLGTITNDYAGGYPKVLFDDETNASDMTYNYLDSYTPVANDRVLLAKVGHGYVIIGKIV